MRDALRPSCPALGVENVKHRAIGCHSSRTAGDGCRQQTFKFLQVIKLGPNVVEVTRGNLADLTTGRLFGSTKPQQRAYLVEREAQFTRPTYKGQKAKVGCLVDATATWRARWYRNHLNPLVVTDRFNIHAGSSDKSPIDSFSARASVIAPMGDGLAPVVTTESI